MALRIATGCTSDTNIQHLHNETNILPLNAHLKLHSSQLRQKSQHPTHPLHKFTVLTENERHKKQTIFDNNNNYTVNINTKSDLICEDLIQSNLKLIHSHIVSNHLSQRPHNKVLQDQTPSVSPAELLLSRETRRTLAQLRTNKSPLLVSYLFSIGDPRHPSPLCPLCLMHDHTSSHLFECKSLPTSLSSLDLWTNPDKVEPFLATWGERLLAATWFRVLDSAGSTLVEWGRQQQQQQHVKTMIMPTKNHDPKNYDGPQEWRWPPSNDVDPPRIIMIVWQWWRSSENDDYTKMITITKGGWWSPRSDNYHSWVMAPKDDDRWWLPQNKDRTLIVMNITQCQCHINRCWHSLPECPGVRTEHGGKNWPLQTRLYNRSFRHS